MPEAIKPPPNPRFASRHESVKRLDAAIRALAAQNVDDEAAGRLLRAWLKLVDSSFWDVSPDAALWPVFELFAVQFGYLNDSAKHRIHIAPNLRLSTLAASDAHDNMTAFERAVGESFARAKSAAAGVVWALAVPVGIVLALWILAKRAE